MEPAHSSTHETFAVRTEQRLDVVDITDRVSRAVPEDVESGLCTVFVTHTTAGVCLNEAESRLLGDIESFLAELVPDEGHDHDRFDGNADSHLRAMLLGASETIPILNGELATGTWQSVLLVECDGPRERTVSVTVPGT